MGTVRAIENSVASFEVFRENNYVALRSEDCCKPKLFKAPLGHYAHEPRNRIKVFANTDADHFDLRA